VIRGTVIWAMAAIALAVRAGSAAGADTRTWQVIETIPLSVGGEADVLTVERSVAADARVRFVVTRPSGERVDEFFGTGLAPLKEGAAPDVAATNQLKSAYALSSPLLDHESDRRILIWFGFEGPDPPTMHVAIVGKVSLETYGGGSLALAAIVRHGASVDLIGKTSLSESVGACRFTYDPYSVLVFHGAKDSTLRYSRALSRAYNRAHYVWAGPRYRQDVSVDTCGARPKLVGKPAR
jgi:hypothetical protein